RPSVERFVQAAPISARPTWTRWLGALSLARLVSGTMRTFFVWTLKVTISPWNSPPTFLKEPMLAMSLLLGCFEPATAAASMAIGKPEAIDDAPLVGRNAAEDGGGESFLPREEWASAQGKKVSPPPLRLRRSRRSRRLARSSHGEATRSGRRLASSGEDVAE